MAVCDGVVVSLPMSVGGWAGQVSDVARRYVYKSCKDMPPLNQDPNLQPDHVDRVSKHAVGRLYAGRHIEQESSGRSVVPRHVGFGPHDLQAAADDTYTPCPPSLCLADGDVAVDPVRQGSEPLLG